jgi:hypothetical protein
VVFDFLAESVYYVAKTKAGETLVKAIELAFAGGDFVLLD